MRQSMDRWDAFVLLCVAATIAGVVAEIVFWCRRRVRSRQERQRGFPIEPVGTDAANDRET